MESTDNECDFIILNQLDDNNLHLLIVLSITEISVQHFIKKFSRRINNLEILITDNNEVKIGAASFSFSDIARAF